jgi:hypothetical protein
VEAFWVCWKLFSLQKKKNYFLPRTHTDKSRTKAYLSQSSPSEIENQ